MARKRTSDAKLNRMKQEILRRRSSLSSQVSKKYRQQLNRAVRNGALEVMNELAEKGPRYTGEFINSWQAVPIGNNSKAARPGGYPYTLANIPMLSESIKEVRRVEVFAILNTAEYVEIALDLEPSDEFIHPGRPEGGIEFGVFSGQRYGWYRGMVQGGGDEEDDDSRNISTAEEDWFMTYINNDLDDVFRRSFRINFT